MNTAIIILVILVAVLYVKWAIVILCLPIQMVHAAGTRLRPHWSARFLRAPYILLRRASRGGIERFCVYTMSTVPSCWLRKFYYRLIGVRMGRNVVFHFRTEIRDPFNLAIGKGSIVGDNAILDARSNLTIGRNVNLSSNVSIYTLQHNHRSPVFDCNFDKDLSVKIEDRVWLGSNTVVLPGVTIGEGAVVCAGAVVTKDVAPYAVVAGIPARRVGERPRELSYEFDGRACWFY